MKTNSTRSWMKTTMRVITSLMVLSGSLLAGADDAPLFESLRVGDTVVRNVRVARATPLEVTLLFDGGGTTLKRQDLPKELKTLYPYDARVARAYEHDQERERAERAVRERQRQEEGNRQYKAALLRQRLNLKERTEALEKELAQLEKEMVPVQKKARRRANTAAQDELDRMLDTNRILLRRLEEQKNLVDAIDKKLALLP